MVNVMTVRDYIAITLVAVAFIHEGYGGEQCPFGWTTDERRSKCVAAMDLKLNNSYAISSCRSCGGDLIRIENQDDQEIAHSAIAKHYRGERTRYFIDMNDKETTNVWKFENGDDVSWFHWDGGQPNGYTYVGGQHCMVIDTRYMKWHDHECAKNEYYICARRIGHEGLAGNLFTETNSCLEMKAIFRRFPCLNIEDCAVACSDDPCCKDMAHDNTECTLYGFDPSQTSPVCLGSSHKVFSKTIA